MGLANHTLLIAKDNSERPIADSSAPIRNEKGETSGGVLVFRDQTEGRARLLGPCTLWMRLVARFLYAIAARVTEALELRLFDLKQVGECVLLRFHGKGRKERWVKIPASLLEEIEAEYGGKAGNTCSRATSGGRSQGGM